jgi:hypothetical protein
MTDMADDPHVTVTVRHTESTTALAQLWRQDGGEIILSHTGLFSGIFFILAWRRLMPRNVLYCFISSIHLSFCACRYYYYFLF